MCFSDDVGRGIIVRLEKILGFDPGSAVRHDDLDVFAAVGLGLVRWEGQRKGNRGRADLPGRCRIPMRRPRNRR